VTLSPPTYTCVAFHEAAAQPAEPDGVGAAEAPVLEGTDAVGLDRPALVAAAELDGRSLVAVPEPDVLTLGPLLGAPDAGIVAMTENGGAPVSVGAAAATADVVGTEPVLALALEADTALVVALVSEVALVLAGALAEAEDVESAEDEAGAPPPPPSAARIALSNRLFAAHASRSTFCPRMSLAHVPNSDELSHDMTPPKLEEFARVCCTIFASCAGST
jgi:hypothetical protein